MSFWLLPNRYWILKKEWLHIELWIYFKPLNWVKVLAINMVHLDVFGGKGCVFLTLGVTVSKNLGGWVGWHGLKIWMDERLLWMTTSVWQISEDPVDVNTKSCRKERKKGQYSILNPTKSHTVKTSTRMTECVCVCAVFLHDAWICHNGVHGPAAPPSDLTTPYNELLLI